MNWINKQKLPAIEAIKYNDHPCLKIKELWQALYLTFNMAQDYHIDISLLDEISNKHLMKWLLFSEAESVSSINKCNNSLTSGPNKLSWKHLKCIIKDTVYLKKIINIADTCFELGYWPLHFKVLTSIIISKLNKNSYDFSKAFRPIVLLNILGKLIEKVIGERLQFHSISNNFIHLS